MIKIQTQITELYKQFMSDMDINPDYEFIIKFTISIENSRV